jgi:hypothetical protein
VLAAALFKPISEGGVGLISLKAQVECLSAKIILWIIHEVDHPLKSILRRRIKNLSRKQFGVEDFS